MVEILVLNALAVFTVTLFTKDMEGPGGIFTKLREKVAGYEYDSEGELRHMPDTSMARLFNCFWCLSTWISVIFSGISTWAFSLSLPQCIILCFASVALAGLIYERME